MRSSPIFLVGAPRSGTTLLLYMLRSHPNLFFPHEESHFFVPIYRLANSFGDLNRAENIFQVLQTIKTIRPAFFKGVEEHLKIDFMSLAQNIAEHPQVSIASIIEALYSHLAECSGKSNWGDKTPYYALHLPLLKEMFPNARIINMVRDGRDVALSMLSRKYDLDVYNFYHAAKYWEHYVLEVEKTSDLFAPNQFITVQYEALLSESQKTLQNICNFLGETYDDSLIEFEKPKSLDTNLLKNTQLIAQPLQTNNKEKWRALMTPRQIATFESACGPLLEKYGYPLVTQAVETPLPMRALYRLHNRLLTFYNRTYRNPFPKHRLIFRKNATSRV